MLSAADKQKLKDCWQRTTQSPAASYVLAKGRGKDGADITVGSIHQDRIQRGFDAACNRIEKAINDGDVASVDDYIVGHEWLHSDIANMTRPMDELAAELKKFKGLQP